MPNQDLTEMKWIDTIWNLFDKKRFGLLKSKYLLELTYWIMHKDYLNNPMEITFTEDYPVPDSPFILHINITVETNKT